MDEPYAWLYEQIDKKKVEPNSSLGEAISYMINHRAELILFLRVRGARDKNLCEQALKRAILHRGNPQFFKTARGAVGADLYMSIIHTCVLNGADPFDYLIELERHASEMKKNPHLWLPWNYQKALRRQSATT